MTTEKLQAKVRRHNMLQRCLGIALCIVAPVLWVGSFWIARWLFYLPFSLTKFEGMWGPSLYVAWAFIALLAVEGWHGSQTLFELSDYTQSDFNWYERDDNSIASTYARYRGDPMLYAWIVTQLVRLAPQTTLFAIQSLRSTIRPTPEAVEAAVSIFNVLKADRHWHAAEDFGDCGPALRLLIRLGLIWTNAGSNGLEIRFPAGMSEAELV